MTISEKLRAEVNKKIDGLVEKNRKAAAKSRLRIALQERSKKLDELYLLIGKECVAHNYRADDPTFHTWYQEIEEVKRSVDTLSQELRKLMQKDDMPTVTHVEEDFTAEEYTPDFTVSGETVDKESKTVVVEPTEDPAQDDLPHPEV